MTKLESLDTLRNLPVFGTALEDTEEITLCESMVIATRGLMGKLADEIQAEIDSRYMPLPVDADGEPIHVGDVLEYDYGDDVRGTRMVCALIYDGTRSKEFDGGIWDFEFDDDDWGDSRNVHCMSDFYECNRHVKPRTVEDVLREFHEDQAWEQSPDSYEEIMSKLTTMYAAELQMRGDA